MLAFSYNRAHHISPKDNHAQPLNKTVNIYHLRLFFHVQRPVGGSMMLKLDQKEELEL